MVGGSLREQSAAYPAMAQLLLAHHVEPRLIWICDINFISPVVPVFVHDFIARQKPTITSLAIYDVAN